MAVHKAEQSIQIMWMKAVRILVQGSFYCLWHGTNLNRMAAWVVMGDRRCIYSVLVFAMRMVIIVTIMFTWFNVSVNHCNFSLSCVKIFQILYLGKSLFLKRFSSFNWLITFVFRAQEILQAAKSPKSFVGCKGSGSMIQ